MWDFLFSARSHQHNKMGAKEIAPFSLSEITEEIERELAYGKSNLGLCAETVARVRELVLRLRLAGYTIFADVYSDIVTRCAVQDAARDVMLAYPSATPHLNKRFYNEVLEAFVVCNESACAALFPALSDKVRARETNEDCNAK